MPAFPAKILSFTMTGTVPTAFWEADSVWAGYPYRWTTTLYITTQPHGSPHTPTPYFYDGNDVAVGDYVLTSGRGRVLKIVAISDKTAGVVSCTVEDEDRKNLFLDEEQLGSGGIPDGEGLLFEVRNGWPILHPLPDALAGSLPPYFSADVIARFMQSRVDNYGTITAEDVAFDYPTYGYTNIDEAVRALLDNAGSQEPGAPPTVTLTSSLNTAEIGATVTALNLFWSLTYGSVVSQSLTDVGALATNVRSYALSGLNLTQNKTYTLTYALTYFGYSGTITGTTSTTLAFKSKRYWGVLPDENATDAQIAALSAEFSDTRTQNRTFSPGGKYIYFAWPVALGPATGFKFNGLYSSAWILTTRSFTNASGGVVSYHIYRSEYKQSGENILIEVL